MNMIPAQFGQPFAFDRLQQMVVVNGAISRLLCAGARRRRTHRRGRGRRHPGYDCGGVRGAAGEVETTVLLENMS